MYIIHNDKRYISLEIKFNIKISIFVKTLNKKLHSVNKKKWKRFRKN